jgi:16S rRNA (uracil1498-N3)-methyltransferase
MARRRFFVDQVRQGLAEVAGDEAHHLTRVLRVGKGQKYEISDNSQLYLAEVSEAHKARVVFRVIEPIAAEAPAVRVTLAAALIKFDRFEWMIEKATELGVERILPFESARSEKGLFDAARRRVERWRRIVRESSQQCRRARLPEVSDPVRLHSLDAAPFGHLFLLDEGGGRPLLAAIPEDRTPADTVCVLSGPEGGWTEAERTGLLKRWTPISLGPRILRAETASIAALAILTNAWIPPGGLK